MKTMTRLTTAFLGSLLVLLGFGGCRSSKRAAQEGLAAEEIARMDSAVNAMRPQIPNVAPPRKEDPSRVRLLYGVPPTRFQERINKEK